MGTRFAGGAPCAASDGARIARAPNVIQVFVTSKAGEVIVPESVKQVGCVVRHMPPGVVSRPLTPRAQVADEGMPVAGHTQVKGVLFIQFEVKFPERLDITDGERRYSSPRLAPPLIAPRVFDAAMRKVLAHSPCTCFCAQDWPGDGGGCWRMQTLRHARLASA